MKYFIILIFFAAIACNSDQTSNKPKSPIDTTGDLAQSSSTVISKEGRNLKPLTAKSELVGIWTSDNKEPLTVEISQDSIYYTEHFESHKYSLKGDSIFISYHDFTFAAKVYFNKDTLVMQSEDGKSKYHRFKD